MIKVEMKFSERLERMYIYVQVFFIWKSGLLFEIAPVGTALLRFYVRFIPSMHFVCFYTISVASVEKKLVA